jgi:hypothetical protein
MKTSRQHASRHPDWNAAGLRSFFGTVAPVPRGIGQHSRILHPRMPSPLAVPAADRVTERQETKGI